MIEVTDLNFSYGDRKVLSGINLHIKDGEFVAVLGPNGAGKSTLLRCIAGMMKCDGVKIGGATVRDCPPIELAKILAYVPQSINAGFMTVFNTVLLGRRPYLGLRPSKRDIEVVMDVLRKLRISHLAMKRTNEISGGELQKVSIARALAQEPRVLLMDEPTNNLDLKSQFEVMHITREFVEKGGTAVVVMHDVNTALRFADRFILMKEGKIIADTKKEALNPNLFEKVYDVNVVIARLYGVPIMVPFENSPPIQNPAE